jgi:WD40 repeat protein
MEPTRIGLPTSTQQVPRQIAELPSHTDSVTDAAWSPSGDLVASIGRDRRLIVYRLSSHTVVRDRQFNFPLMHVAFLNDDMIVLCDFASNVRLYAWEDEKVVSQLHVSDERANAMALSPTTSLVAFGHRTGLIQFVEYRDFRPALTTSALSIHGAVWQLAWSATGIGSTPQQRLKALPQLITAVDICSTASPVPALFRCRSLLA